MQGVRYLSQDGYEIFHRYKDQGLRGLVDRARSPYRHPNKLPLQVETAILRIKRMNITLIGGSGGFSQAFLGNLVKRPSVQHLHATYNRNKPDLSHSRISVYANTPDNGYTI